MSVAPEKIKDLRQRTGVAMSKCKEALEQAGGDIDQAIEYLRKSGIASAVKKEGRETKEGVIRTCEKENSIVFFELSAETDFVVSNEHFQTFARNLVIQIEEERPADLTTLLTSKYAPEPSLTVEEKRALIMQTVGENIQPKRFEYFSKKSNETFGVYSHMNGRIVTMVLLEGSDSERELANDLAMHVCASAPEYLNPEAVPQSILDQERDIARSQMQNKPANMVENIVEGKLKAYYKENCFLQQMFLKDTKQSIEQVLEARSKQIGKPLKVTTYVRWSVK